MGWDIHTGRSDKGDAICPQSKMGGGGVVKVLQLSP